MRASGSAIVAHNLGTSCQPMRICLVYDCLFPHTVGGAERWYRSLAERLAADGHEVTYLTLRQWARGVDPGVVGVDVRVVGSAHEALQRIRPPPRPAAAGVRRRRPLAPDSQRRPLRRRTHLLVSILLAACRRAGPARAALPPGCRLVRGLVPGVLARLPGTPRRRGGLAGAATLCPHPATGVLLLGAVRGAATRGGYDRRDHDPGRSLRRARAGPAGQSDGAAGCVRRQTHPGEVRPGDPAGDS